MNRYAGKTRTAAAAFFIAAAVLLVMSIPTTAVAVPVRGDVVWTDDFQGSTLGLSTTDGTMVAGDRLRLAEGEPVDLGPAVPGETAVYSLVATGLGPGGADVYCGTGEKGHLVQYDPAEVYQEGYQGPPHWGVANSRGQAMWDAPEQQRVPALTVAGALIYGGTYPDGHLFSFDPATPGTPPDELGTCPDASGAMMSLAYNGSEVCGGTQSGHFFTYDGAFSNRGQPSGSGDPVNALVSVGAVVYIGSEDGNLYGFAGGALTGSLGDAGSPITALSRSGTMLFLACSDGHLWSYDMTVPGSLTDLGQPPGESGGLKSVAAATATRAYVGSNDGHIYVYDSGWGAGDDADLGVPTGSGGGPVNALALAVDGSLYGGTGTSAADSEGHLFRMGPFEDHGTPGAPGDTITGITYTENLLYLATQAGNLYSHNGAYSFDLKNAAPLAQINSLRSISGTVYLGLEDGHLWSYRSDRPPGSEFVDHGAPGGVAIDSIEAHGTRVYAGLRDGSLFYSSGAAFIQAGQGWPALPGALNDLAWSDADSVLYIACEDGHLYRWDDVWDPSHEIEDLDAPGAAALNALTDGGAELYIGLDNGGLYSYDGAFQQVGDCGSSILSIAGSGQGVACGIVDGHMWLYDETEGLLRDAGQPNGADALYAMCHTNNFEFAGTLSGGLFSREDALLGDRGQVVPRQIMIWCAAYDADRGRFYAGTYQNAHFLVIDPAQGNRVIDRGRPVNGERELEDILVTSTGTVYGSTYGGTGLLNPVYNPEGGVLFGFEPVGMSFTEIGRAPNDDNWWMSSLAEGPGGLVYGSTCPSSANHTGRLFEYTPGGGMADLGALPLANEGTRSIVIREGVIYGGTQNPVDNSVSHVYSYDIPGASFEVLGEPPIKPGGSANYRYVNEMLLMDGTVYGSQENGCVFSFDPGAAFAAVNLGLPIPASESVYPLASAANSTFMCGVSVTGGGHMVNYDPSLAGFRDVCVPEDSGGVVRQDRVSAIAYAGDAITPGTILGGTLGSAVGLDREAGRLFTMAPYRTTPEEQSALSAYITPKVRDQGVPVAGHEGIGALCAGPSGAKTVIGGTRNSSTGPDAEVFVYSTKAGGVGASHWPVLSGYKEVLSLCSGSDGYVYGGTGAGPLGEDARLFRFDPDTGAVADLGAPRAGAKGIFSAARGANGRIYAGTGDEVSGPSWEPGHLVEYDPKSGSFSDKGIAASQSGRLTALTSSGSYVYGGTGVSEGQTGSARFLRYNTSTGVKDSRTNPAFSDENTVNAIIAGPSGKMYFGTGPHGKVVMYDPSTGAFTAGTPYAGASAVLSLSCADGALYGCTETPGYLFKMTTGGTFTDMGPLTYANSGVAAGCTDNLGKPYFGTLSDCRLVRFDPDYRFTWDEVTFAGEEPVGSAAVDVTAGDGTVLLSDVTDHQDISALSATTYPGLRLQARLQSPDPGQTPAIDDWGLCWSKLPGIDEVLPGEAYAGDLIYLWGSNFGAVQGGSTVSVGGAPVTSIGYWSDSLLQARVPGGASSGQVLVTVDGHASNIGSFSLLEPPVIGSLSPASAHVGDTVKVRGSWFLDDRGGSTVSFEGAVATEYLSWTDSEVRVRVPAGAKSGPVRVTVNGHVSNAKTFTVAPGGNPQVTITAPGSETAHAGSVSVRADVTASGPVARVELWLDGRRKATDTASPYSFTWDSDAVSDGAHELAVKAIDAAGRSGRESMTVFVDHTVPRPAKHWYFAEGCTDYGFETWVLVENPADEPTVADVVFMDDGGQTRSRTLELPPKSRATLDAGEVAPSANVSIEVEAEGDVVCERSMYWGSRVEGHGSVGASRLSKNWYFAEGCTDYGFETYVLLGNPSEKRVTAWLNYMFTDGTTATTEHVLEPHSRQTVNAAEEVGAREFGVRVDSEQALVAERAMYLSSRRCGTVTIGCQAPSTNWYLSEGSTDWGFETWLLLQRPEEGDAAVDVTYRLGDGSEVQRRYDVKGNSRYTVNLAAEVGVADVSTQVVSDRPVVCERSMYWGARSAGHCTVGSPAPGRVWYLAEGCTDFGFETWVLVDNPSGEVVEATVTFMKEGGAPVPVDIDLPAHSRTSLDASDYAGAGSFGVEVQAARPVMVERAIYFSARGGGTGSIGARGDE